MKNILLILIIAIGLNSFAQKYTLTDDSTGYEFELYSQNMFVKMDNDTVKNATFSASKNQLAWGNTKMQYSIKTVNISDSIVFLLKSDFENIVSSVGVNSFSDDYGIYTLNAISITYSVDSLSSISCIYSKQLKSPNGILTERFITYNKPLNESEILQFQLLLLGTQVEQMYIDWYNEILGND
jgi:hypothetical protein